MEDDKKKLTRDYILSKVMLDLEAQREARDRALDRIEETKRLREEDRKKVIPIFRNKNKVKKGH